MSDEKVYLLVMGIGHGIVGTESSRFRSRPAGAVSAPPVVLRFGVLEGIRLDLIASDGCECVRIDRQERSPGGLVAVAVRALRSGERDR